MLRTLPIVLVFAACQFSENRHLTRQVSRDEVVGTWVATPFAIKSLGEVGVRDHLSASEQVLVLRPDGSCTVRMTLGLPGSPSYREYDAGCTWQLGHVGEQALRLALTPRPGSGDPYFYLAEERGQLILWWYAADPDSLKYLELEKRTASNNELKLTRSA
jgi:hypothetical protein